jgi:peptidoglycan/xylan/chitin deacetylase (PgdA/CDA1 family)
MLKAVAKTTRWSGAQRLAQSISRRYEISRPAPGHAARLRRVQGPKFVVLCYHRVGSGGVPFYSNLDPAVFEAQVRFLRRAYRIVTLDEMCRELEDGGPAGQAIAITFDDGYRDVYTHAFPVLRRYGVPATVYLTAAAIETGEISWYDRIFVLAMSTQCGTLELNGNPPRQFTLTSRESRLHAATEIVRALRGYSNRERGAACAALEQSAHLPASAWEPKDRMLNWDHVREMQGAGISFGAHTMSHPVVSQLAGSERRFELGDSKRLLESRLQSPVGHFAFPFGSPSDIDAESCAWMPHYGYRSAVSTVWGVNTPETPKYLLRRIGGDEPSLSLFALRLRWLFLNEPPASEELQALQLEVEHKRITPGDGEYHEHAPEAEVKHA